MKELLYLEEPKMKFAFNQSCEDVRDGLALFGPLEQPKIYGIRSGVIGTKRGLEIFKNYLEKIQKPVYNSNNVTRPFFPGFEAVFNCKWEANNISFKEITDDEINDTIPLDNNHTRTYEVVNLFLNKILQAVKNDEDKIDVWFVIVPDVIFQYCRPNSSIPKDIVQKKSLLKKSQAKKYIAMPSLFEEDNLAAEAYKYDAQFHDQLKARLLPHMITTQILRESTLAWESFANKFGQPLRNFKKIEGHLAWTVSTAAYYKAGGKPWKLSDIREGVCYLGLVYKQLERDKNVRNACCAAQMFLDSGDGTVFKGAVGPWYNPKKGEFHLKPKEAKALLSQAIKSYQEQMGDNPKEMFIHSKTKFNKEEWDAFKEVVPEGTDLVGISIDTRPQIKLFKGEGAYPIMRGNAFVVNERSAFLWTIGYVPKTQTTLSLEVPNPIFIEINKGEANIEQVLKDIMALTKLNYNACIYADGIPVTLRFADKIGEILTASTDIQAPPLAFKYYI